jgi:enediyne biosynthesis protein E3
VGEAVRQRFSSHCEGERPCLQSGPTVGASCVADQCDASHATTKRQCIWDRIRRRLLSIPSSEVRLNTRGFQSKSEEAREYLESIGHAFLGGYHETLNGLCGEVLVNRLDALGSECRGFAYEGAAMAAWLLDSLSFVRRDRWSQLLKFSENVHPYVVHVGAGWALARLPWSRRTPEQSLSQFDPLLRWLVLDGYGFHEGYFHAPRWIRIPRNRPNFSFYARRVFDQGLGRSLWFVEGADVLQIAHTIATFDHARHADLWSGVGLACAYAGQATVPELKSLMTSAGMHLGQLQQGITFGAEARVRGQISNEFTQRTCMTICRMDAESAAELTRMTRTAVEESTKLNQLPQYEQWRILIHEQFSEGASACR